MLWVAGEACRYPTTVLTPKPPLSHPHTDGGLSTETVPVPGDAEQCQIKANKFKGTWFEHVLLSQRSWLKWEWASESIVQLPHVTDGKMEAEREVTY